MVEMHRHRNVRVFFRRRFHQLLQVDHLAVFQRAAARLDDHRAVRVVRGLHDRLDLFHVVDVERANAIVAFGRFIKYLSHGYEWHNACSPRGMAAPFPACAPLYAYTALVTFSQKFGMPVKAEVGAVSANTVLIYTYFEAPKSNQALHALRPLRGYISRFAGKTIKAP